MSSSPIVRSIASESDVVEDEGRRRFPDPDSYRAGDGVSPRRLALFSSCSVNSALPPSAAPSFHSPSSSPHRSSSSVGSSDGKDDEEDNDGTRLRTESRRGVFVRFESRGNRSGCDEPSADSNSSANAMMLGSFYTKK
jgi:hypothetical protein